MNDMNLIMARELFKIAREMLAVQFYTKQSMREYRMEHEVRPDTKLVLKPQSERKKREKKKEEKKKKEKSKSQTSRPKARTVRTKDKRLQGFISGVESFMESEKFDNCFDEDEQFDKTFVMQSLKMDLSTLSPDMKGKSMNINMILIDVSDREFHEKMMEQFKGLIKDYAPGQGQALPYRRKLYAVMYCDEQNGSKQQIRETAVHEVMHLLDSKFDEDWGTEGYWGHPVEQDRGEDNNYGIPYPGMYGDKRDDELDNERFAEYYTCKSERKEITYSLMALIDDYSKQEKIDFKKLVQEMIDCLDDKDKFTKLYEKIANMGYDYSSLMMLYHLAFSKQKNGDLQDAKKILENLM